uniref:Uncharacterized protein n=1 Tax=Anopheles atroparvus TaxID=41427 RepID=A0A182J6T1_ANOAO
MSGHNPPHGRLGQPNASWNPLQVPSYVPRQPQLAHMSSERSMARSPLTWHTPPNHQDKMYRCTSGNLMNNLEMNPLLQGYGRNVGMPLGSVDLSLSSASRNTPSPKSAHTTNVQTQPSQPCSSSSTLPSSIPSPGVYNMAGDSGHHSTNHQTRTSASTNSSGGVIQSTTTVAAMKERMQGTSYMGPGNGNTMNCFGGNTNSLGDGSIIGGNGFGANLSNRAANDPNTLVTGGLLIKDAKQINSEMDNKNGRDCFPHLPAADSAELVKEFIMQTMQNSNALSVSPKRTSPARSALQAMPSPTRSRSPPLNLLLGSVAMDGNNLPVPATTATTESTDSGNSSGATLGTGSLLPGPTAAGVSSMPSNNPAASPTNNSITSSEDSIDSLNGRSNARRRRKPERTSKMNTPGEDESNAFFPATVVGKGIDGATIGDLEPLRPGSVVRGDVSALAIEGINALSQALTGTDGLSSNNVRIGSGPIHTRGGHGSHENHTSPLVPPVQQHLPDNLLIQSNINSSTTKAGPSIHTSSLGAEVMSGNGSTGAGHTHNAKTVPNSAPNVGDAVLLTENSVNNANDYETIDKIAAMVSSDVVVTKSLVNNSGESFISNGTIPIDLAAPERNCNGPTQQKSGHGEKIVYKQGDKPNASDSSYEEVENKLEEMFAGIEEIPGKPLESDSPGKSDTNRNNGCHDLDQLNQLNSRNRTLPPAVTDGDVLKQLSSDAIVDEEMKDASLIDGKAAVGSGITGRKKPLTPAQKRGYGAKSLAAEMVTSTPVVKRKRAPKKKSKMQGNPCPFPSPDDHAMAGLMALATKKKKGRKGKSTSVGEEGGGRTAPGVGKKGKVQKKAKGGNKNNEQTSSTSVWATNAPSIEPNGKYKGPYVQVKTDGSHTVINAPINEEDGDKPQSKTKKFGNSLNSSERSKIRGLHVSTLSTKYDADTTDTSWMCVFCKTGPHKFRLGDLFGPYIISTTSSEFQQSQIDMDYFSVKRTRENLESQQGRESREQQKQQQMQELAAPKGKKRKNAAGGSTVVRSPGPSGSKLVTLKQEKNVDVHMQQLATANMFYGMIKAGDDTYEVWMHEDCLVWAPGVYMVGTRMVGLEAAIWNCCRHQCDLCTHYGAVVSCLRQGCSNKAHFICAHKQNWKMSHDFQSFCAMHADREGSPSAQQPMTVNHAAPAAHTNVHTAKQPRIEFKPDKDADNLSSCVS